MKAIVADVQKSAATGDFAAAATRITDWETDWQTVWQTVWETDWQTDSDDAEAGMRPLDPDAWGRLMTPLMRP